jgi:hypothetical protein
VDLLYVAYLLQGCDGIPHDREFLWPIENLLHGNGLCVPSIDDAFVVLDWDEDPFFMKDRPIPLDERVDLFTYVGFQMRQVEIFHQLLTMFGLVISAEESGVHLIQCRGWMLELAQDWSAINIVEQVFVVLGLIRESSVVDEHIVKPPARLGFVRNTNGRTILSRWQI